MNGIKEFLQKISRSSFLSKALGTVSNYYHTMKPIFNFASRFDFMPKHSLAALTAGAFLCPINLSAEVTFTFPNEGPFDGGGIGAFETRLDAAETINVTLTTVGVIGQDGSTTGNTTNSLSNNALGINSLNNLGGFSNQLRDFNPGEAWVFSFDVDVNLVEVDFAGWAGPGTAEVTFSSAAFDPIVLNDDGSVPGAIFDLENTIVPAGTEITLQMTSDDAEGNDTGVRMVGFTVAAIPPSSVGTDLVWAGDSGDVWDTLTQNFTEDGTPSLFELEDNVTIQTPGIINVDAGGVTANTVIDGNETDSVSLQGGILTAANFTKSGAGTFSLNTALNLNSGVFALSGGVFEMPAASSLSTTSSLLSGGATLDLESGATFTSAGSNILGEGGFIISNDAPITFFDLINTGFETPFTKSGSEILTINGGVGVQTTGPIDLDILEGGVTFSGSSQINIGGENTVDGNLILEGPLLMLHASNVAGSGQIGIQSPSTLQPRFNAGAVEVGVPVDLSADLTLISQSGDNEITFANPITGDGDLIKEGNGIVILAGENTYEGNIIVNAGTLRIGRDTSGFLGDGNITVNVPETGVTGTIEFARSNEQTIFFPISGEGDVSINNPDGGRTSMHNSIIHSYTGVTRINEGALVAPFIENAGAPSSIGSASTDATNLIIRGLSTLSYTGSGASTDRNFSIGGAINGADVGGGTISVDGSGPLVFTNSGTIGADGNGTEPRTLTLTGDAPGTSVLTMGLSDSQSAELSLSKSGSTTWQLDGSHSYTGNTSVEEGLLILSTATLDNAAAVIIATGAQLELTHGVGDLVDSLELGGTQVEPGIYGSSTAVAGIPGAIADDACFSGSGYLVVTGGEIMSGPTSADYLAWSADLVGGPNDDDDLDGLSNFEEYAFGLDPEDPLSQSPFTVNPDLATGTFTFTRRNGQLTGFLNYIYETAPDLQNFTSFTPDSLSSDNGIPVETLTITLPSELLEQTRLFMQIRVQ